MITTTNILLAIIVVLLMVLIRGLQVVTQTLALFKYEGFPDLMDLLQRMYLDCKPRKKILLEKYIKKQSKIKADKNYPPKLSKED